MEKNSNDKIKEALHLLDEAAREKKDDLQKLVADKYQNLKGALSVLVQSKGESFFLAIRPRFLVAFS